MFNVNLNVRQAVRLAITSAAAVASAAAMAQTASTTTAAAAAPSKELEEVIVTGTRISRSPNEISVAPVATLTATDIQQTGLMRVEDLLNNMPQVIAEQSSGQSISTDGTASVSLRGLGSYRTLVLINGRRMQPGAGLAFASSPDINQIPSAMIERVDILTGGASATYGADAVAGVVNFIMNTHFEGVRLDFDYGQNMYSQNNDFAQESLRNANIPVPGSFTGGQNRNWSFMAGSNFADGKGNATVYGTYTNTSPVVGSQIDYAGCTLNTASSVPPSGQPWDPAICGGSSSSATGRFLMFGLTAPSTVPGVTSTLIANHTVDKTTGLYRGYKGSTDSYNYGALSYLQRQANRYTAGAFLNYDISDTANVYSETMFARNTSRAEYGSSGLFAFGDQVISCSNPLFTQSELDVMCNPTAIQQNQWYYPELAGTNNIHILAARRSVETGPRVDNYSSNSIREVVGTRGAINDAWTYDAYGQYGITQMELKESGFLGAPQINNALNVIPNPAVAGDPTTGVVPNVPVGGAVCAAAVAGFDPACVPWNIWNKGGVNQAQLDYLTVASGYGITATEYIASGSVTGDLGRYGLKFPSAANGIDVNIGTEWRQETYTFSPDYIFSHGYASGGNGIFTPIDGTFHVNEYFFETKIPIADNLPGIYHLGFEAGYRYSTYTSNFNTNTFKLGLEWAPIQDIKLRGSFNRAVRAPSIGDLYTPPVVGAGGTADLCWGAKPNLTAAQCARTGVTAQQYTHILANPAAQINTSAGGNINLTPETADTYTVGFVLQPQALQGFLMSVDYYDIKINDTIQTLTSNTVLTQCGVYNDQRMCDLIHRDPKNGSLWFNNNDFIDTNELNSGFLTTKGIDLSAHYMLQMGAQGKLGLSLTGTRVTDFSTQPLTTTGSYDCTGYYGSTCGSPTPDWRHVFEADWATPWAGLDLTARWRYIGPVDVDTSSSNPQLAGQYQPGFGHIGGYSYIDLSAAISWGQHMNFRVGVNNVAAKGPPIVLNGTYTACPTATCNDNTWVGTYDTMGRYLFAHISAKF